MNKSKEFRKVVVDPEMTGATPAKYQCVDCGRNWLQPQSRTQCVECGSLYCVWLNFDEWRGLNVLSSV